MRLLALLEDPDGPSARLRFEAFRPGLVSRGVEVSAHGMPPAGARRRRLLESASDHEVVFLQRRLLPVLDVARLRRRARRLVFDFDDAIGLRDHPPHRSLARAWKFRRIVRCADLVLAGSDELARLARCSGRVPRVVPSTVTAPETPTSPRAESRTGPAVLLWVGQPSTARYLLALAPLWERVVRTLPAELVVVGGGAASRAVLPFARHLDWSPATEDAALAEADVGLAPLPDDPWTRGKCGVRLLRYLAAAVPAVASPVGAQREVAERCGGTRLARRETQWEDALRDLLSARERVRTEAAEAARAVARLYSPPAWEERFCTWVLEGG